MEKRKNPLESHEASNQTLSKRINPLELNEQVADSNPPVAQSKKHLVPYEIKKTAPLKRKLVFTRLSKDLSQALKRIYPDTKFGVILENAMLSYLQQKDIKEYDAITELLSGKEDQA